MSVVWCWTKLWSSCKQLCRHMVEAVIALLCSCSRAHTQTPPGPPPPPCCSFVPICCLVLYILLNLVNKARLRTFSVFVVSALANAGFAGCLVGCLRCHASLLPRQPPSLLPSRQPAQVLPRPVVLQLASKEIKLRLDDEVRGQGSCGVFMLLRLLQLHRSSLPSPIKGPGPAPLFGQEHTVMLATLACCRAGRGRG